MKMFQSFLDSIPKNRSEMVNELDLPEDVTLSPYVLPDTPDWLSEEPSEDHDTASTASSVPISRAMTDSDIDYGRYRRYKSRSYSDPWDYLRSTWYRFPSSYLASLESLNSYADLTEEYLALERSRRYNEELRRRMAKYFDEECRVFEADDPGLLALENALLDLDLKALYSNMDI